MKASKPKDEVKARLEAYGEQFMALFEDEGETVEKKRKRKDGRAVELNSKLKRNSSNHKASVDSFLGEGNEEISRLDPDVEPLERVKRGSRPTTAEAPVSKEVQRVEDWKEARKQFMSSKADKVLGISAEKSTTHKRKRLLKMGSADSAGHEMLSKEEFEKVKREVQLFGASALDKRSKKKFDSAFLAQLGSRPEKGMKIPASIAIGMAKKRKKREAIAFEEAVEAGMVKRKGSGKRKRMQKLAEIDRGLMEDGGAFKSGVLKLNRKMLLRKRK